MLAEHLSSHRAILVRERDLGAVPIVTQACPTNASQRSS
jgi:hypothetical protein